MYSFAECLAIESRIIINSVKNLLIILLFASNLIYAQDSSNCVQGTGETKRTSNSFQKINSTLTTINSEDEKLNISEISEEDAKRVFHLLKSSLDVSDQPIAEGCYARAHQLSLFLNSLGLVSIKAFAKGNLKVSGFVWQFHVAPALKVKTQKGVELWVFDTNLFNAPLPEKEWLKLLGKEDKVTLDLRTRFTYKPIGLYSLSSYKSIDLAETEDWIRFLRENKSHQISDDEIQKFLLNLSIKKMSR